MPYIGYQSGRFVAASAPKGINKQWQKMIGETVRIVDMAIKKAAEARANEA